MNILKICGRIVRFDDETQLNTPLARDSMEGKMIKAAAEFVKKNSFDL